MFGLAELWRLFAAAVLASAIAGLVLPLVGALVFLRRSVFLGVAVPQFASAGVGVGLWLMPWFPGAAAYFLEHGHPPFYYLLWFAVGAAGAALWIYGTLQGRDRFGSADGRLGAGFALASSASLLFLAGSPLARNAAETLFHGEILYLDYHGLEIVAVVYALVLAGLLYWRRVFLLIGFDPDAAVALGHSVLRYERIQMFLLGLAIGCGVMTLGPPLVFGLLFLPPLAARQVARTMRQFMSFAAAVGVLSTVVAWPISLQADWPYGPTAVVVSGALAGAFWLLARLRRGSRWNQASR